MATYTIRARTQSSADAALVDAVATLRGSGVTWSDVARDPAGFVVVSIAGADPVPMTITSELWNSAAVTAARAELNAAPSPTLPAVTVVITGAGAAELARVRASLRRTLRHRTVTVRAGR